MDFNDFLKDDVKDILAICNKAQVKFEEYKKGLKKKLTKKEEDTLAEKFVQEELDKYMQSKNEKTVSNKKQINEPSLADFYEMDDLEFDEMNDIWDEMDEDDGLI